MKGRGVRVISDTELNSVTSDARHKIHFLIVDAIGVCERDKTDSRPLERRRSVPFEKLLDAIALSNREEEVLTSLAGRVARLEHALEDEDKKDLQKLSGGSLFMR
jgi:type I restriction enzyme R subunit